MLPPVLINSISVVAGLKVALVLPPSGSVILYSKVVDCPTVPVITPTSLISGGRLPKDTTYTQSLTSLTQFYRLRTKRSSFFV